MSNKFVILKDKDNFYEMKFELWDEKNFDKIKAICDKDLEERTKNYIDM